MAYDPSIFNISPYYDDFDAQKAFLRVLFKPGYALQARELTQAQTILQNQISKIGDNLFKDGSRVVGGNISIRTTSFIMMSVDALNGYGIYDYSALMGAILKTSDSAISAKVVHYVDPDSATDNKLVLVVDYTSGTAFADKQFTITLADGTLLVGGLFGAENGNSWNSGKCKLITVGGGVFYVDGFFVTTSDQTFSPYYSNTTGKYRDFQFGTDFAELNKKVGFSLYRNYVTDQEDNTLRDTAIGSYNYNAPGADRYKIELTLAQADLTETPTDFLELIRFEDGTITKKVERITYGEIENTLARRTYDESGSYTVRPFDVSIKSASDETMFNIVLGTGKAYVLGHELESAYPQTLSVDKARTTVDENNIFLDFSVGNIYGVTIGNATDYGTTFGSGITTVNGGAAAIEFINNAGTRTATGFVHGAIPSGSTSGYQYNLYLYGVSGAVAVGNIGTIKSVGDGTILGKATVTSAGVSTANQSLVFELKPSYAVNAIKNLKFTGKATSDDLTDFFTYGNSVMTITLTINEFSETLKAETGTVYRFPLNRDISSVISEIQLVNSDGLALQLDSAFVTAQGTTDGSSVTLNITNNADNRLAGFTEGGIRVTMPIVYDQSNLQDSTGYYRWKQLVIAPEENILVSDKISENGRSIFELSRVDVFSVSSVTIRNAVTAETSDVTDYFEYDDGQREAYYTYGRLVVKPSYVAEVASWDAEDTLTVSYSYFEHRGLASAPFVGKLSYPDISYGAIPLFTNTRTGNTVSLANCLDFRHVHPDSSFVMKPYGISEFSIGEFTATEVSYDHYLPRIDKVCLRNNPTDNSAQFFVVSGTPDLSPSTPADVEDALTICTLSVPAYTHSPSNVSVTQVDTQRFTMADIGKIQKRVDDIEVFTKLSLSEAEIEARSLKTSSAATEPLKTSVYSDEFFGHSVADVSSGENICSVDYEWGELRPFFTEYKPTLTITELSGTTLSADGIITLNYSGVTYIENKQYTKTVKVNPSNTLNWLGFMQLSTSVSPFFDLEYRPVVKTNSLSENDNWLSSNANNARGFGTQWNDWESLWTGIPQTPEEQDEINKRTFEVPHSNNSSVIPNINSGSVHVGSSRSVDTLNQKTSNFIRQARMKNRIKTVVGSRVVDRSVVPYVPSSVIGVTAYGLKPNTGVSVYFDGDTVISGITTDSTGTVSGVTFSIPAGQFLAGEKVVRISDSASAENATTAAEVVYYCTGILNQRDSGCVSTRPPVLRRRTVGSEGIVKDPFNVDLAYDVLENSAWCDPLAQTFFVDRKANPEGIFLKSLTLFFATKDSSLPVTVQIRPTVNGYPSPSVVVPFSTVTKQASAVNADANSPSGTVFKFSSPVFLESGEYAICIIANSNLYSLYAVDSSINTTANGDAIAGRGGNNQRVGTLYFPQGIGPAVQDNNTDLMFTMERCVFIGNNNTVTFSTTNCSAKQIIKFAASEVSPVGCRITRRVENTAIANNENLYLRNMLENSPQLRYTLSNGASTAVSPILDTQTLYGVGIEMRLNDTTPSSYVSRVVTLDPDVVSNGLQVFLDANLPSTAQIAVYFRCSQTGESDIFTKPWTALDRKNASFTSTSELDFREAVYRFYDANKEFKSYQVKVDMWSENGSSATYYETPALKNVRTISFYL
jgi:hypothetical protein